MTLLPATIVDTDALLNVIWLSFAAGVGGTAAFSLAIIGVTRYAESRRAGSSQAVGYAALGIFGALVFLAVGVLGLIVMIEK